MRALIIKFAIILIAFLPLRLAHILGSFLGYLMLHIPNASKQIAAKNIAMCLPELSQKQQHTLLKQTLMDTGKTGMETGALWSWNKKRLFQLIKKTSGEQ